ncbi:MAG: hypothetical protein SFU56_06485 [Capsulimonadales bacterium]|nr:hypothetical protein [Capsulimonadales bacterium]
MATARRTGGWWTAALTAAIVSGCGSGSGNNTTPGRTEGLTGTPRSADAPADGNVRAEGQVGRVGIFLSATPDGKKAEKSGRLWAGILKVELIDIQEKAVTVFEAQDGANVDLTTLYETGGRRFQLLACPGVPSGKAYIRARVTFGPSFSRFSPDAPTGVLTPLADLLPKDERENPILSFPLTRPRDLGNGRENLVIDFDLAGMQVADGRITPALREGDQDGLSDLARQIPTTFVGTVRELTGKDTPKTSEETAGESSSSPRNTPETPVTTPVEPKAKEKAKELAAKNTDRPSEKSPGRAEPKEGAAITGTPASDETAPTTAPSVAPTVAQTPAPTVAPELSPDGLLFTLTLGTNRSVTVQAGEATVFDNEGPTPNPTLPEGKKAAVRGILDPVTKRVLAERITLLNGDGPTGEMTTIRGAVTAADSKNHLLVLTATQAEGILPTFAAVTVQMSPDVVYRSRGGVLLTHDEFHAALTARPGATVSVTGAYEPVTGSLRGKTVRLEENTPGTAHEATVTGTAQSADEKAGTLTLGSLTLWQGIVARGDRSKIPVVATAATAYRDEKGQFLASASFWQAAKSGRTVHAVGIYTGGKLTATRLELVAPEALPGPTTAPEPKGEAAEPKTEPAGEPKAEPKNDDGTPNLSPIS